ncbi:MAG TPA: putative DNA-binding domain-containing protein [Gammaproteobacteria bacterium]|nr:putative DNA-binding domain-containing protein [Gammaproteobacteria bacterium]
MLLRKLQENWQQGVFDEQTDPIMPYIINPEDRAMIYIDSYRARLIEALEKTFLLLLDKMGEDDFCDLALEYIDAYPSEYYSLAKFGQYLSGFLKKKNKSQLAPIAEIDWAISHAVDAKTVAVVNRDYLQTIPQEEWSEVVFELHPSLTVLDKYRVYRKQTQVYYLEITEQERQVLQWIQQGYTFGEICEKLCVIMSEEEVVNYLIQQLLRWLDDELITAITVKEKA